MGKISDYTRVLAAKLADVFVVDQTDNGTTETKSATVEQIGTAIGTLQNFADLDTSNKNLVDAINEIASYTPVYGNTASGSIATFDTSLALPLQDCTTEVGANKVVNVSGNVTDLATYIRGIYQGNYGFIDVGSMNWDQSTPQNHVFRSSSLNGIAKGSSNGQIPSNAICANYTIKAWSPLSSDDNMYFAISSTGAISLINQSYSDIPTFKTAMNGTYLIYELVTQTTPSITQAQLTTVCASFGVLGTAYDLPLTDKPTTYVGTNNIFCDTGNTSVMYACSLKDYIDSQ